MTEATPPIEHVSLHKMAAAEAKRPKNEYYSAKYDFTTMKTLENSGLTWRNEPANYQLVAGEGLKVNTDPKTDYWLKTYRDPPANRASGHCLMQTVSNYMKWCAEVTFSITPNIQYDQAGIMVYSDDSNWLKAGIEIENDQPNMSCVATRGESDWNYMEWPAMKDVRVRVTGTMYKTVCDCLVEYYNEESSKWCFLREAPIAISSSGVSVGIMCCSPKQEDSKGMEAMFKQFSLIENDM